MGEIKDIQRQFREGGWKQFLTSIKITNLRGWDGQIIDFLFPVTAFVGENGMGKSTVLRAAACAYQSKRYDFFNYYPSTFFINTQWDAKALDGATIEYDVKHGDISSKKFRWRKTKDWDFHQNEKK